MYALATHLITLPVVSLQTGETVASVTAIIIDPDHLKLMGFKLNAGRSPRSLLVSTSVRQLAVDCVIIDDEDELSEPGDVVRIAPLLEAAYTPMGKLVVTDTGRVLGNVEDYTINLESEFVQKLYVRPPMLRAWFSSSLIIDRTQILDTQANRFIVRDTLDYATGLAAEEPTI